MKTKHLVLDKDIHDQLKAKKKETGATVKEIANSALRAALALPTREELVVAKLVEEGKITREEYSAALSAAAAALRASYARVQDLGEGVPRDRSRTMVYGSWEGREVACAPDRSWQIIEAWGRDARREITPPHTYENVQAYGVMLAGKMKLECGSKTRIFAAPDMFHFPTGHTCASAPLSRKTRLLMVFVPAVWEYRDTPEGARETSSV